MTDKPFDARSMPAERALSRAPADRPNPDEEPRLLRPRTESRSWTESRPRAEARPRPDARPMRLLFGVGSIAALSALAAAILTPAPLVADPLTPIVPPPDPSTAPVKHIVRYVQLKPGQTAPPQAVVRQAATPKPRVVTIVTRQSGVKP